MLVNMITFLYPEIMIIMIIKLL